QAWSERTRGAALEALGRIGSEQAVQVLVAELEREGGDLPAGWFDGPSLDLTDSAPVRRALVTAGQPAVAPLMSALASTASPALASGAALALGELGAAQALPEIVRATQRGTVSLDAAFWALAALGDDRALPFVLEHLDAPDARVRHMVIAVAARLLDPKDADGRVVDPVRSRVREPRTPLGERLGLIELLGRSGSVRAQQILLSLAEVDRPALRLAVVDALGQLGRSSDAVDRVLLEALADSSQPLRLAAATALARVGGERAARRLLHALGVSAEQDRGAIGIALSGSLSRSQGDGLLDAVRQALAVAPGPSRDALIEGLGRMPTPAAGALLAGLARVADGDDRRKVAEALAGHPSQRSLLTALLADPDPTVRANAAWSLGRVGTATSLSPLQPLLEDGDVAVAGNAALALGRIAKRAKSQRNAAGPLCGALEDYRSYVRVNALVALRLVRQICPNDRVRRALHRDRSWRVRLAAADVIRERASALPKEGRASLRLALERCAAEDRDATVARRCRAGQPAEAGSDDLLVFVVPHGAVEQVPRAPYALVRPDGALRLGVADRRGALFEAACPRGAVQLAVPAALAP
ncbi:MAG: HEAT repeat domain-containing protein, partial [Deltaproteobacteria bacterium]|nr:HEAT repeat domain-containing protein [Deltaproteobacteria bacterium]MBW2531684.1 HEAT repeat domain-containing protein [Deltaproteobacteria bacterium]